MLGKVRNMQQALRKIAAEVSGPTPHANYHAYYMSPKERVVFHPKINPMLHLLEALWVMSGRPAPEGFASYGPALYKASVGEGFKLGGRHQWFATAVNKGSLDAEIHVRSSEDLYQLVSDATCFSAVQERVAYNHNLAVGTLSHVCDDVSQVDFGRAVSSPYESGRACDSAMWSPSLAAHLGMFLDEGAVLGMSDRFLGRVADPSIKALQHILGKSEDRFTEAARCLDNTSDSNDWSMAAKAFIDYSRRTA